MNIKESLFILCTVQSHLNIGINKMDKLNIEWQVYFMEHGRFFTIGALTIVAIKNIKWMKRSMLTVYDLKFCLKVKTIWIFTIP